MIAGINRLWVLDYRHIISAGYNIGKNRIGFIASDFEELKLARDTANYECQKSGNIWEHKIVVTGYSDIAVDMINTLKKQRNRYVIAMYLNTTEMIIVGVDSPLIISAKNTTGNIPGEISGSILTFTALSRTCFNYIDKELFLKNYAKVKYGKLYNWFAVNDIRGITHSGWRIPTYSDYLSLLTFLGSQVSGGKLKETGLLYWDSPNTGATNEVKFNARGSSYRDNNGFGALKDESYIYTSTESSSTLAYRLLINTNSANAYLGGINKKYGASVRVLKNSTLLPNGFAGIYKGNDGTVYRTICINGTEWLADNLKETKYANGEFIPEEPNMNNWNNLETGACCNLENNENNI